MEPEIVPAILVRERDELLRRIGLVKDHVKVIMIDVMDNDFVPNLTVGPQDFHDLPEARYEFHWMVKDPQGWIRKVPGDHMHLVHVETITSFDEVKAAVKEAGGRLGLAINPETHLESALPYIKDAGQVLIMTVHPGFSGQSYLAEMEGKMRTLRKLYPDLDIEVDGGINKDTIGRAYAAGANMLAAASAIYSHDDIGGAIEDLRKRALAGGP